MVAIRALLLLVGLAVAVAGCRPQKKVAAGEGVQGHQRIGLPEFRQGQRSNFQRYDVDRDNVVEYADLPKKVSKRFRRMDSNKDSRLTISEFEAASLRRFVGADANRDGWLDNSELN